MSKLRKYHTSKKARDDAIVFPPKYTSLSETPENQPAFEVNEMVERLPKPKPGGEDSVAGLGTKRRTVLGA